METDCTGFLTNPDLGHLSLDYHPEKHIYIWGVDHESSLTPAYTFGPHLIRYYFHSFIQQILLSIYYWLSTALRVGI